VPARRRRICAQMTTTPSESKTCCNVPQQRKDPHYVVRAGEGIPLSGQVASTPWEHAAVMPIDQFMWYQAGKKQATTLRVMYDSQAIYLQFICQDIHIFSKTTELNGGVCMDSCVEFFASPNLQKHAHYFNIEVNACRTMLLGWGPAIHAQRIHITPELAREVTIVSSVAGATKEESPQDNGWWLAARVPFATLEKLCGEEIRVAKGTVWKANAYRCGGQTDGQFASWAWVDGPVDFHRPQSFGEVKFE